MSDTALYLTGNLLGRALVSYGLVWCVLLVVCRFNVKLTFRRSVAWYSWFIVVLLTLLGLAAQVANRGGLA
jgi:hypothetical protein